MLTTEHLPDTKIIKTTNSFLLEDLFLALGFEQRRQWGTNIYKKDDVIVIPVIENHFSTQDPQLFLDTIKHSGEKIILIIQGKENTGGWWVVDPKTGKRISRNGNDLQKDGVTYDDVMHPRHPWKYANEIS